MTKFFVEELMNDDLNRLGYYFIGYINSDDDKVAFPDCTSDELNIPLENYVKICKDNGATNYKDYSDVEDLFTSIYQAQVALQELLEFSVEWNKCRDCGDCDCDDDSDEESEGVVIPFFPSMFEEISIPECCNIDDETINNMIQCCIGQLEDNLEQDAIEISTGNVLVVVNRKITSMENGDEDCDGCDSYSYDVKVCKNYYEFIGDQDYCEICKLEND